MTSIPPGDPSADGWRPMKNGPMPAAIGVPWSKRTSDGWRYGLLTTRDHVNPEGAVHGGILMLFADHTIGLLAWDACKPHPAVTIQFNTHFLSAVRPGDFVELAGEVTRATSGLVFVRGILSVGAGPVAAVDGIWRVLRARP